MTAVPMTKTQKGVAASEARHADSMSIRKRRMRRVRGLAFFAALAPFLAAVSIGAYALVQGRRDILLWTLVPWAVCGINVAAWWWASRRLRVSRALILWSVFGGLTVSVFTFGTHLGGMTLFLAWTVVLAAMLYGPAMSITMTGLSMLVVVIAFVLESVGILPWIPVDDQWERWGNFFLGLVYPLAVVGSVYMYADYIQETLATVGAYIRGHMETVLASAHQQAATAQQQAAAVQEISATAEELSRTAEQIAANSRQLDQIAQRSYGQVEEGGEVIRSILETVQTFADEMQTLVDQAVHLNEHSQRVGEIATFITRISDETHLIALNAAIEAASAGEHGQRFAVIAAEIRRLAERAVTSGQEIKRIIHDVQQTTQTVVMNLESEMAHIHALEEHARTAGLQLEKIVEAVDVTRSAATELADAAEDLRGVSQQLAQSLHEMSHAAEELARNSKQTLQVAQEMEEVAATVVTSGV